MKYPGVGTVTVMAAALLGSLAGAQNPTPKPAPLGQGTIRLTSPQERQVFQRDDRNRAMMTVAGKAPPDVDSVEARLTPQGIPPDLGGKWTPIAGPGQITKGEFRGTLPAPAGWYDLHVRGRAGQIVVSKAELPRVGVGEVFVVCGQSNSANHGNKPQTPKEDRVSALTANSWQAAKDPQPLATGDGGSPWPLLGDMLVKELDVPVAFASCGYGGTTTAQWQPDKQLYPRLQTVLKRLGPRGARAILWHQGESDALSGVSTETYQQNMAALIAASRRDAGWEVPWVVAAVSYLPANTRPNMDAVLAAQRALWKNGLALEGPDTDIIAGPAYRYDAVHFNEEGLRAHAVRWQLALRRAFFP